MKFADRLKFTANGTSAATITFGAAVAGFRTPAQAIADGALTVGDTGVPFTTTDSSGNWEDSAFTITSPTVLTRTSVLSSSAGGTTPATFIGGTLTVISAMPAGFASKLPVLETDVVGLGGMFVVSPNAPTNTDGRPNGTVYYRSALVSGAVLSYVKIAGVYQSVASPSVAAGASAAAQMVIFAGQSQSNSNGTTSTQTLPAAIVGPMADVFIWDPFGKTWLTYEAQVTSAAHLKGGKYPDTSQNYVGAEAEYARRWKLDNPGVPLYMVKKGHSTTSLSQAARTANRGCWDPALRGDLYDEFLSWMTDAKANLVAAGKTVNIRGMNWTQGENDAGSTVEPANAYGANLSAFIDALRSAGTITSTTPFIISRIQTGTWAFPAPVRAGQQLIGETKPYCRWFSADAVTIDGSDTVHYGPNGIVIHGDLMYEEGMSGAETVNLYSSKLTTAPTADRKSKLAAFVDNLISNGLWSGISVMQVYASADANAALTNLRNNAGVANVGANSGMTFTADQGYTGTSTTSFINTNVNPVTGDSKLERGNVSYAFYVRGNIATTGVDVGFIPTTSGNGIVLNAPQSTSGAAAGAFRINNSNSSADNTLTGPADVSGLWSGSRKALNSCTYFFRGAQVGVTDTVNTDVGESSNVIFVGNRNSSNNTSGTNGTLRQYGMFIAGSGRTPAQEAALNTAVTAYLTSIGAN